MSEWKTVRLGDVCEILNGYAFKSDKYVDSGIRVIRITNVQKGFIEDNSPAFYPITEKETLKDYELHENDLLISLTGNVGRVALLSKEMLPAALNQRVGCIRIRDKNLLISYLFTFLNSDKFESDCIYSARGIAQKNMSTEWLKNYLIPLPPIEVQIKIANNLNTCSKIIKKHNKQLNNFDLLIKSRFIEMFGNIELTPQKRDWKELKEITKIFTGTTPSTTDEENWNGTILWITPAEMTSDSFMIYDTKRKITEKGRSSKSLDIMPIGTVLLSTRAPIGKTGIVGNPMTCNQGFKNFLCNSKKLNPIYLYILLRNNTVFLNSKGSGTTFKELSKSVIEKIKIPIPPLTLQTQFADFVQQIDKSKFEMEKIVKLCYTTLM